MHCPLCGVSLKTVERLGIELDHCTQCGGFWLDQGELDLLVQQEAMRALTKGQQALSAARDAREYDRTASRGEEIANHRYDVDAADQTADQRFAGVRFSMARAIAADQAPSRS